MILNEGLLGSATSLFVLYKIISKMLTDIKETPAYKLGIVDDKGKILRKSKTLETQEEKDALTLLDVFVFNLKRTLGPLGRSKLVTIAGSAFLLKEYTENDGWYDIEDKPLLLHTKYEKFMESLTKEDYEILELIQEDAIANVTGPAVAGTTGEPPGPQGKLGFIRRKSKKKKKKKKLDETTDPVINKRSIKGLLGSIRKKIVEKHLTIDQIANTIEVKLKRKYDLDVEVFTDNKVPHGSIIVGADYDPHDDEMGDTAIRIKLRVTDKKLGLYLSDKQWDDFSEEIAKSVEHEYLHMAQYQNRDFHSGTTFKGQKFVRMNSELKDMFKPAQGYFGRPDEVEAFALNTATELLQSFKNRKSAIRSLKKLDKRTMKASPTLLRYMVTFSYDVKHPTIRNYLKKVFVFLQRK